MVSGTDWSREEVEACVADYLQMLTLELNGQRYVKRARARSLMDQLDERSLGAVEFKRCNISAVLIELGYPYINGYKRRHNFQRSVLTDVVESMASADQALQEAVLAAVSRPAMPAVPYDNPWVARPKPDKRIAEAPATYAPTFSSSRRDYLAQEARNRSLGRAGELFVLDLEARRLHAAGKKRLADKVEHVSVTQGDGLGYDVHSYEDSGQDRLIEVKTTSFGEDTPFFVSRNELARSQHDAGIYHLYRVFDFRLKPRVFSIDGSIDQWCRLDAVTYRASLSDVQLTPP
jgi:hypothetical protein